MNDIYGYQEVIAACQRIADLVGRICRVPATLLMRQNAETMEVIIASNASGNPYKPKETANLGTGLYCETVIAEQRPLLVPNAQKDPEWNQNPDIDLGMIFYYGVPVNWPDGTPFGTFCILDNQERACDETDKETVREFAEVIEILLRQIVLHGELAYQVDHDSLTGCLSRTAFFRLLRQELDRFRRYQVPFSMAYLDIDRFKTVNDNHGHAVGDLVLRHIGRLLDESTRDLDFIGRIGGEEFAICLPSTDHGGARNKAERIRKKLMASPYVTADASVSLTVSFGVGQIRPDESIDSLVRRTDAALYTAKADGRNVVRVAPQEDQPL